MCYWFVNHSYPFPKNVYSGVSALLSLFCFLSFAARPQENSKAQFKSVVIINRSDNRISVKLATIGLERKSEFDTWFWEVKFWKFFSFKWGMGSDFQLWCCVDVKVFAYWDFQQQEIGFCNSITYYHCSGLFLNVLMIIVSVCETILFSVLDEEELVQHVLVFNMLHEIKQKFHF